MWTISAPRSQVATQALVTYVGFGRAVASETGAPNVLANMGGSGWAVVQSDNVTEPYGDPLDVARHTDDCRPGAGGSQGQQQGLTEHHPGTQRRDGGSVMMAAGGGRWGTM
jgi:hypothetical protein